MPLNTPLCPPVSIRHWLLLTWVQVDVVSEEKVCGCLCVWTCEIELAEVGHVEDRCFLSAAETFCLDLRHQH